MHSLVFRNLCEFGGNLDGAIQAAKLIDKSSLLTLRTGPNAALSDRVDILRALVAALCDLWNELLVVHSLDQIFELRPLFRREFLCFAKHAGLLATNNVFI